MKRRSVLLIERGCSACTDDHLCVACYLDQYQLGLLEEDHLSSLEGRYEPAEDL